MHVKEFLSRFSNLLPEWFLDQPCSAWSASLAAARRDLAVR